jgi:hypothetical protein
MANAQAASDALDICELLRQWEPGKLLSARPEKPIRLWSRGGCGVWIDDSWGPAVPYPPVDHGHGAKNHGYARVKGDPDAVALIPEAQDWPELQDFLRVVNAADSPIETVGCEKAVLPIGDAKALFPPDMDGGPPTVKLGSYVDMMFTDLPLNDQPENILLLCTRLAPAIEGCGDWWNDVTFALQRFRFVSGTTAPWGLMLHMTSYGRDEGEARRLWGVTLGRLSKRIGSLPKDLRWTP